MKKILTLTIIAVMLSACNTTPINNIMPNLSPQKALGVLEINLDSSGISTAKFQNGVQVQAVTFRENDSVLGTGTTQVISSTNSAFDYLVATFPVSHTTTSTTAFNNLTIYALVKSGNVGNTAIKSIINFGGVTNTTEQIRLAKLIVPVHAVTTNSSGNVVTDNNKADFQAFTTAEVTAATIAAGSSIAGTDTILNYGFTARCATNCTANSRRIPTNGTGNISIALRVPKAATNTAYKFVMNFVVLNESIARVTRGVYPPETLALAETRGSSVGATRLMQLGLDQSATSTTLSNDHVNDVQTSSLGASIQALNIGRISTGDENSCGLTSSGKAYCWGSNDFGQLGNNTKYTNSLVPVAVDGGITFASISTGSGYPHTCGLNLSGKAYCWGRNSSGQLGNGTTDITTLNSLIPVAVDGDISFTSISVNGSYSCGLTSSGTAYCWGATPGLVLNSSGAYQGEVSLVPKAVSGYTFASISVGATHTCALTISGSAYCWGSNRSGALGNNGTLDVYGIITDSYVPVAVSGGITFTSISPGTYHTCGLASSGTMYCWGGGYLGNNYTTESHVPVAVSGAPAFASISVGENIACGLTSSGIAYCWGAFSYDYVIVFQGVGYNYISINPTVTSLVPVAVKGGYTFTSISAGFRHACGVTSNGATYCWGSNYNGQYGNNSTTDSLTLTPVPVNNTNYGL
jgi:alpha-tubulin suppressor-like RCC1 family protein